jgi:parallel beta-helix repeat protein
MKILVSTVLLAMLTPSLAFGQGPLNPPGPPSPLMKTLDQLEPRTPIDAVHTPGDATSTFRITASGSYYLTGNLTGEAGKNGIFVDASNVTIDLNGFTMTGGGDQSAILTRFPPLAPENTTVRNGTVTNWGFAIIVRDKARLERVSAVRNVFDGMSAGNGSVIVECIASSNGQNGLSVGASSTIRDSTARENGGTGIAASSESVISNCTVSSNTGFGLAVGGNSTVQNCSVSRNGSTGIAGSDRCTIVDCVASNNGAYGIIAFDDATVQRCTATSNRGSAGIHVENRSQVMNCVADNNGAGSDGSGITAATRGFIKQCSAAGNRLNGIAVAGESIVAENRASANGQGATAAGIRTTGSGTRIEANQTRDNVGYGIQADPGDIVLRNSAGNNTVLNFSPASGTNIGPIQTPSTATNPFANIQF